MTLIGDDSGVNQDKQGVLSLRSMLFCARSRISLLASDTMHRFIIHFPGFVIGSKRPVLHPVSKALSILLIPISPHAPSQPTLKLIVSCHAPLFAGLRAVSEVNGNSRLHARRRESENSFIVKLTLFQELLCELAPHYYLLSHLMSYYSNLSSSDYSCPGNRSACSSSNIPRSGPPPRTRDPRHQ